MGLNKTFQGVWTNPNPHSAMPEGAARYAQNVVNPSPGVAEVVAGQETLPGTYSSADERFSSGISYEGCVVEHTNDGEGEDSYLYVRDPDSGTLTPQAGAGDPSQAFHPPDGVQRIPFAIAGQKLYMATNLGLQVMDGIEAVPGPVGLPTPFGPDFSLTTSTGVYPLAPGESVAYRTELRRHDRDSVYEVSVPSGRIVAKNNLSAVAAIGSITLSGSPGNVTVVVGGHSVGPIADTGNNVTFAALIASSLAADTAVAALVIPSSTGGIVSLQAVSAGTSGNSITLSASRTGGVFATASGATLTGGDNKIREISLQTQIPANAAAGDLLRVYRTGLAGAGIDPGDTMYLVQEHILTGSDIAAGTVTIADVTPDALRGEPLYTNATAQGITRQNERPPYARVLVGFDDALLLANVRSQQRLSIRFLATTPITDTITIAGQVYTAGLSADYPNGVFEPYTSGTVSENIATTAQRLVHAINGKTTNTTVYAYYASSESDPPGIIQIEARDVTTSAFTAQASAHGDRYEPNLTTAQSSSATTEPNGIWVSKRNQHYAFPPLRSAGTGATYRFRVGVKGNPILAMAALRESIIVFVAGEGVWRVRRTGNESWRSDPINAKANLLVPDSVAVINNQVLALTTRGLVAVDDGGVEEIDLPIKDQINAIRDLDPSVLLPNTFAVGDEDRLRYTLYHPQAAGDTTATHAWVYNSDNGTWTERTDPASGGFINENDDLLYLGSASSNTLTRERTGTAAQKYKRPDGTAIPVRLEWTVQDRGRSERGEAVRGDPPAHPGCHPRARHLQLHQRPGRHREYHRLHLRQRRALRPGLGAGRVPAHHPAEGGHPPERARRGLRGGGDESRHR